MLIEVIADEFTTAQMRAYAEYRFFAVLVRHARLIRTVQIVLRRGSGRRVADAVTCLADVVLEQSESIHVRATRREPYGAIDRAAEHVERLMRRRLTADVGYP
jgi:ribosome-associated translation inhibitor RaiA